MAATLERACALGRLFVVEAIDLIECRGFTASRRRAYMLTLLAALAAVFAARLLGLPALVSGLKTFTDFDSFQVVGRMVLHGEAAQAYHWPNLMRIQTTMVREPVFMPWTYPPPFDLVAAVLSLGPRPVAYGLFTTITLAGYLLVLHRACKECFVSNLMLLAPAICITMACGQNGFLTGALFGLAALGFRDGRAWTGFPLGLLVIKPHLAIGFGVFSVIRRRWGVVLGAGAVIAVTSLAATLLLGAGIWPAFLAGVKEAGAFLKLGVYPLNRMISPFSVVLSLGLPASAALAVQALVAGLVLVMICRPPRGATVQQALGLMAMGSLLISPYAYDYDLPILGIGLALLAQDLRRLASTTERAALYALILFTGGYGNASSMLRSAPWNEASAAETPLALAGLTLTALMILVWQIIRRHATTQSVAE